MTRTSTKPLPIPLAMSTAPPENTPSPIPSVEEIVRGETSDENQEPIVATTPSAQSDFPNPKVRLECRSLDHKGAAIFFSNTNAATILSDAISIVLSTLYSPTRTNDHIPGTRSVTLILRSMNGVAYTTGIELDDDHKEIHFSLDYIKGISPPNTDRETHEIKGVLVHEMVHCWQWNGMGTAPSGLIEGIADYVRLRAGLEPPHWKRELGGQWDAGYQHTGYFLDWIEENVGRGSVRKINDALKGDRYKQSLWQTLFGRSAEALWSDYQAHIRSSQA